MISKKFEVLNEVDVLGKIGYPEDSTLEFLRFIQRKVGEKLFRTESEKILKSIGGREVFKKGYNIDNFVFDIFNWQRFDIQKNVRNHLDTLSHLGYVLSKKFLKLKESQYLEFIIEKDGEERNYFFFDPETQIYIGYIKTNKLDDFFNDISFPPKTYVVNLSNLDKSLLSSGMGKLMYLTILEDIDVLISDNHLYESALNIWLNTLPRYVQLVGAIPVVSTYEDVKIITPETKLSKYLVDDYQRYFATQKPEKVKIKKRKIKESELVNLIETAMDLDIYNSIPNVGTGSRNLQSEEFIEEVIDKLKELLFMFKANKKVDTSLKSELNKNLDSFDKVYNKIKSKSF